MRNNQPVTQKNYNIPSHYRLISSTDKRGILVHCNDEFTEVSGFDRDELIGKNHNIVRHPDMPVDVFKEMWATLSAGKIWMGLVKNRRKNGDHYWVSAFVTPVFEKGQIAGYESVRVPAQEHEISRAEYRYARLRAGKSSTSVGELTRHYAKNYLPFIIMGVVTVALLAMMSGAIPALIAAAGFLCCALWMAGQIKQNWKAIIDISPESYSNLVVAQTYFDDYGNPARAKLILRCELARSRTALARIQDAAGGLDVIADTTHAQAENTSTAVVQQNEATQNIASAVNQMSQSIQSVSERVDMNAESARSASKNVEQGNHKADEALNAIMALKESVSSISQTVQELADSTNDIGEAASLISTIAEQTNLLALNAAIEAARAGEQGRGFAVVADEVRSLASKTRESTDKIHHIIHVLAERSDRAVRVSKDGVKAAEQGASIVEDTRKTLTEINGAVSVIADQTFEMASAVEQQSSVAEHINQQIVEIADGAKDTLRASENSLDASQKLRNTVTEVYSVINRFTNKTV